MTRGESDQPLVLHLSGDFPDPINPQKTPVIERLLELSADSFEHHVVSINRVTPTIAHTAQMLAGSGPVAAKAIHPQPFEHGVALTYQAPGRGILHETCLNLLGDWLCDYVAGLPRQPDLLIAHKLTIEGIAVARASRQLDIPYVLSIQGNTDAKILKFRPDLTGRLSEIFHQASGVFPFTPWSVRTIEHKLGARSKNTWLLPCPTELDDCIAPKLGADRFISVFHLRNYRVKNLNGIAAAFGGSQSDKLNLDIVGGGNEEDLAACARIVGGAANINLVGPRNQTELRSLMNDAVALVLPSRRESFGLVFIEALQSGCPIIYPRGAAVDGYFDDCPFALAVDPGSVSDIRAAIEFAAANEAMLKDELAQWQNAGGHIQFTRPEIAKVFREGLKTALSSVS